MYERDVKRGQLLTIIPRLGRQFKLSYEFKITKYGTYSYYYYAALHMTNRGNSGYYGSRMPYIAYYGSNMRVYADLNGKKGVYEIFPRSNTNEWTTIEVSQHKKEGLYMYTVTIDGEKVHEEGNKGPAVFPNTMFYASDPWNSLQSGVIRNLSIETSDTTIGEAGQLIALPQRNVRKGTATCRVAGQAMASTIPP